jgi:hypothetical protein
VIFARNFRNKTEQSKVKTLAGFVVTMFVLGFGFAPSMFAPPVPPPAPSFTLLSPKAGQVLNPGENVRVEWKTSIPNPIKWPSYCELELWLSLDGGGTYPVRITPSTDPRITFFYWTVPNTPTNGAVLDIRFGCEPISPEAYSPQTASPFVIAHAAGK